MVIKFNSKIKPYLQLAYITQVVLNSNNLSFQGLGLHNTWTPTKSLQSQATCRITYNPIIQAFKLV